MFEIVSDDIKMLSDDQLRTLVARIAIAELQAAQSPISGVTAGGDQNAPDGGIDVRVETHSNDFDGDFIPRLPLGFQVKKPDMNPAAILDEMAPEGILRPVISELAEADGAYIIVSAQGTLADKPLKKRREAMKSALGEIPFKENLHVDFYDRERLTTWVNKYPGATAWVREKTGRGLAGWESVGKWLETNVASDGPYLIDDEASLLDARAKKERPHSISEGLEVLRRELRTPGTSTRLIGVSGVGKTRFVQALFENEVGDDPLDPAIAIYTDYSEEPTPTAKQLAHSLVETGQRAILIVDNCNPQTHSELTQICSQKSAQISLLTVEYDVRGDEPERTEVFRLSAGSSKTIADWIEANFDHVSSVDRDRIAEFSGGNFRVARVLAETLKKGDTFAELTDAQLFERIFHQRNDPDQQLLKAAQVLSLVYSYEGEDTGPDSELVLLGEFAGLDPDLLYEASAELQKRQVVQSRGRWRAVLPHAIANRLAAIAIDKTPPLKLENFLRKLPLRLIKSVSRRLGYLHESERAKALILGLLKSDGPWGDLLNLSDDGMQVLRNLAPVAPKAVLERIQEAVDGPHGDAILNPKQRVRWQIVELVRALAYEPKLFDQAACLLSRFVLAETPDENQNSAKDSFQGLFQLYLSGTMALPAQRRAIALALFVDVDTEQAGLLALRSLLNAGHFSSSASFDFGARPRTFGWEPKTYGEQWEWHVDALALAAQLCERPSVGNEIGSEVANQVRSFVTNDPCLTALEEFADTMLMQGPWIDGWREVRMAQRFDSDKWPQKVRDRVGVLEEKLRPSDRASEIQAWVLSGYGFYDLIEADADDTVASYERRGEQAQEKARQLGAGAGPDREALSVLLPDLLTAANSQQVFHFGRGLAQDCTDRSALWQVLLDEFEQLEPNNRKIELLGGFFAEAHKQNDPIYGLILDHCLAEESLQLHLVYFQGLVGYDNEGMQRIWTGVENGTVGAIQFSRFACGLVRNLPTADLPMILKRVAGLEGGASIALEIAHMAIHCAKSDKEPVSEELLQAGREILAHNEFRRGNDARQHAIKECLKFCYEDGQHANQLRELAVSVQRQMDGEPFRAWEYENILAAIFEASPEIGLEVFVAGGSTEGDPIFGFSSPMRRSPIEQVDPAKLWEWADQDAQDRFPTLGRALKPFPDRVAETVTAISQTYLDALERAPDASAFLSAAPGHLGPSGWMGNLSSILDQRRESFEELLDHPNEAVRLWAAKSAAHLGAWADSQREKEAEDEERFE